jgi:hypothetical protein
VEIFIYNLFQSSVASSCKPKYFPQRCAPWHPALARPFTLWREIKMGVDWKQNGCRYMSASSAAICWCCIRLVVAVSQSVGLFSRTAIKFEFDIVPKQIKITLTYFRFVQLTMPWHAGRLLCNNRAGHDIYTIQTFFLSANVSFSAPLANYQRAHRSTPVRDLHVAFNIPYVWFQHKIMRTESRSRTKSLGSDRDIWAPLTG